MRRGGQCPFDILRLPYSGRAPQQQLLSRTDYQVAFIKTATEVFTFAKFCESAQTWIFLNVKQV